VYTEAQARRGAEFYGRECGSCHGEGLNGKDEAPALVGSGFLATWDGQSVGDLFEQTRKSMPQDKEGAFTRQEYLDVIAYILSANELPAGAAELPRDALSLGQIRIVQFPSR
jgi:quinoprotein glucose dehydrogenase